MKPVDPAKSCEPGVLNHVLRFVPGPDVRLGVSQQLGPQVLEDEVERLGIPLDESLPEEGFDGWPGGNRAFRRREGGVG